VRGSAGAGAGACPLGGSGGIGYMHCVVVVKRSLPAYRCVILKLVNDEVEFCTVAQSRDERIHLSKGRHRLLGISATPVNRLMLCQIFEDVGTWFTWHIKLSVCFANGGGREGTKLKPKRGQKGWDVDLGVVLVCGIVALDARFKMVGHIITNIFVDAFLCVLLRPPPVVPGLGFHIGILGGLVTGS
jgi:hypothetical protein